AEHWQRAGGGCVQAGDRPADEADGGAVAHPPGLPHGDAVLHPAWRHLGPLLEAPAPLTTRIGARTPAPNLLLFLSRYANGPASMVGGAGRRGRSAAISQLHSAREGTAMQGDSLDRRGFLAATGAGVAGLALASETRGGGADDGKAVRCGFVGVGSRGSALLRATLQVEGVEVVAVCDIDAD